MTTTTMTADQKDVAVGRSLLRRLRALGLSLAEGVRRFPLLTSLRDRGLLKLTDKGTGIVTLALAEDRVNLPAASGAPGSYANASVELAEKAKTRQIVDGGTFAAAMDATLASDADLAARYRAYSIGDDRPNASIEVAARAKARKAKDSITYEQAESLVLGEDPDLAARYDTWRAGKE